MTAQKKTAKSTTPVEPPATQEVEAVNSKAAVKPAKASRPRKAAVRATQPATTAPSAGIAAPAKAAKAGKATKAKAPALTNTKLSPPSRKGKVESGAGAAVISPDTERATVLDSEIAFEGPLFRVFRDHILEPGGRESRRDVIRHNGSVVILAVDFGKRKPGKRKKDPWVVIERQFRYAADQFLWELPAGKLDAGEAPIDGAKRELAEETGYEAKKWSPLVEYFASPGFLGESMKVFLAEGLIAGDAHPEEDEEIDFRLVRLSDLLKMIDKGNIKDGKTLTTILLYARKLGLKRKK